jgi:hypothetical protein
MADEKPKLRGKPLPLTEEDLERWSKITPAVIGDSIADARRRHPELAALLEAKPVEVKK